jgi:hypothetical protein
LGPTPIAVGGLAVDSPVINNPQKIRNWAPKAYSGGIGGFNVNVGSGGAISLTPSALGRSWYSNGGGGQQTYVASDSTFATPATLSCGIWVVPDQSPQGNAYARLLETRYDTGFYLGQNAANASWMFLVNDVSLSFPATGGSITVGKLHFIAATYDGSILKLYQNGMQVGSTSHSTTPTATEKLYIFGANPVVTTSGAFKGWYGPSFLTSRVISARQIADLWAGGPWGLAKPIYARRWLAAVPPPAAGLYPRNNPLIFGAGVA